MCVVGRLFFFLNDTAPTEISTLSLPDALPICRATPSTPPRSARRARRCAPPRSRPAAGGGPSPACRQAAAVRRGDRKSTRLNSSHSQISYAVFCLKKKKDKIDATHHTAIVYHN